MIPARNSKKDQFLLKTAFQFITGPAPMDLSAIFSGKSKGPRTGPAPMDLSAIFPERSKGPS